MSKSPPYRIYYEGDLDRTELMDEIRRLASKNNVTLQNMMWYILRKGLKSIKEKKDGKRDS